MTGQVLELWKILERFGVKFTFAQTVRFAIEMRRIFQCPCCKEKEDENSG